MDPGSKARGYGIPMALRREKRRRQFAYHLVEVNTMSLFWVCVTMFF